MSDPNAYLGALNAAHQQGYTYTEIAQYHDSQGWEPPPQPALTTLLSGSSIDLSGVNTITVPPSPGPSISDQDFQYDPAESAPEASPTQFQAGSTGTQPSDFPVPGTNDTSVDSGTAPWESSPGVAATPSDQDI